MRTLYLLAGVVGLTTAQTLSLSDLEGLSTPPIKSAPLGIGAGSDSVSYDTQGTYDSTYKSVYASPGVSSKRSKIGRVKRTLIDECTSLPLGSGPVPDPDTAESFLSDPDFSNAALSANTPAGWVNAFTNLQGSTQSPMGYLGYDSLTSYSTDQCAANCQAKSGCQAFNIYFERDPVISPGPDCTNPNSTTVIKCVYWGTTISADTATNTGQWRNDFHVVIAGSNGYNVQTAPTLPGYDVTSLNNATINADTNCNSYITNKVWNDGQPFDPARCAAACEAESQYNIDHLCSRSICRFFNTYILLKNGVPQGQVCALYTRSWDISYATNFGEYSTDGVDHWTRESSYTYSNHSDPGANICNHDCMSQDLCPSCPVSSTTSSTSTSSPTSTLSSTSSTSSTTSVWTTTDSTTTSTAPSSSSSSSSTSGSSITSTVSTTTTTTAYWNTWATPSSSTTPSARYTSSSSSATPFPTKTTSSYTTSPSKPTTTECDDDFSTWRTVSSSPTKPASTSSSSPSPSYKPPTSSSSTSKPNTPYPTFSTSTRCTTSAKSWTSSAKPSTSPTSGKSTSWRAPTGWRDWD